MSLRFKFVNLTFIKEEEEIIKNIRNTIILKHFFDQQNSTRKLSSYIEGTQYGYNASAKDQGTNKFLRISDITDGKVDWDSVPYCDCEDEPTYLLEPDDILIARTGGTTGKSYKISSPPPRSIYAGYLIRIRANEACNPDFISVFLNSYAYWTQITSLNKGEFRPSVNAKKLQDLILPDCNSQIQEEIVQLAEGTILDGHDQLIDKIEETIKAYRSSIELSSHLLLQKEYCDELRQSIIQEAIQGKLTTDWREKNPDVEPAWELLERIKAEKARLVKDKKIRKLKKLPVIDESERPFLIPENWVWCRFQDIVNFNIGKTPSTKQAGYWTNGKYHWLSISDMIHYGKVNATSKKITVDAREQVFKNQDPVPIGTLLMSFKLTIGKVSINNIPLYHNEAIASIYPMKGVEQEYVFYVLPIVAEMSNSKKVLMGQTFNSTSLAAMLFPLPPVPEQIKIVSLIKARLNILSGLESEMQSLTKYSNSLLQAVLKEAFES